ncbi:RluA family pseudouridine synthase [Zavarzinella formosa]|uniref:RluA family pseudouridine synthase n=1 Tax=Zavarzinella formosa TaxID=360055 RepID=UPI0002EE4782|nr:RluA family pseudouridine synthase [Zavarzinella formosa]
MVKIFIVGRQDANQTLAAFLKTRLLLPWSKTKELIEKGAVRVASQPVNDPAARLKLGKQVEVTMFVEGVPKPNPKAKPKPAPQTKKKLPELPKYDGPMPSLIYSDDSIVIVDKPAGLTTMRNEEEAAEFGPRGRTYLPLTLAELLPVILGRPGKPVLSVHRIDKETTGLVVFARTRMAETHLNEQFKTHKIDRRYLALVRGTAKGGKIESTIARDRGDGRRGSAEGMEGQHAATNVSVLEQWEKFALVECRLETGRTHQVRIHLGEAGTPLCGETVYDRPLNGSPHPDDSGANRPMLHATRLGLTHPITGDTMTWESPMPSDMKRLLASWKVVVEDDQEGEAELEMWD